MFNRKNKRAFTLIELIIVVAIIAILAVTAFILLNKYMNKSRNSKRKSDVNAIVTSLQVYNTDTASYPKPDKSITIALTGSLSGSVASQGVFSTNVKAAGVPLNSIPKDPLDADQFYTYTRVDFGPKGFEIAGLLEPESNFGYFHGEQAYAVVTKPQSRTPYIVNLYGSGDFTGISMPYISVYRNAGGFPNTDNFGGSGTITVDPTTKVVISLTGTTIPAITTGDYTSPTSMGTVDNYVDDGAVSYPADACTLAADGDTQSLANTLSGTTDSCTLY